VKTNPKTKSKSNRKEIENKQPVQKHSRKEVLLEHTRGVGTSDVSHAYEYADRAVRYLTFVQALAVWVQNKRKEVCQPFKGSDAPPFFVAQCTRSFLTARGAARRPFPNRGPAKGKEEKKREREGTHLTGYRKQKRGGRGFFCSQS
jgi:hypothetical protein